MIWKIFFVCFSLFFILLQLGGITNTLQLSEFSITAGYILNIAFVFIAGYFYSLGWEKKLYSSKANNIIFAYLSLFVVLMIVLAFISGFSTLSIQVKFTGQSDMILSLARLLFLVVSVYSLLFIPIIVAYFKYKHHSDEFSNILRPYWKIFLTYLFVTLIANNIYCLIAGNYLQYNLWDLAAIILSLVGTIFAIGYSYNLKLGKQILWKILYIPYIIMSIASIFMCSEEYMDISGFYTVKVSYSGLIFDIMILVAVFYAFYRYAFTQDVYVKAE